MAETLSKFGVPLDGTRLGILHPKQSYRSRVIMKNSGAQGAKLSEMTQNVVSVSRPSLTSTNDIEVQAYNSKANLAGKHYWADVTLKLRDDITSAVASHVGAQMQKQFNFFEQTSAVAGINYKFSMEVHVLDGTDGDALEVWNLEGCYLGGVEYGEHDYGSSDAVEISMTIKIDNATHVKGPAGTVDPMPENGVEGIPGRTFG